MRWIALWVALSVSSTAFGQVADAEVSDAELSDAEAPQLLSRDVVTGTPRTLYGDQLGLWFEAGFSGGGRGDERADFVFSPELGLRFRADRRVVLDASWGFTAATTDVSGEISIGGEPTIFRGAPTRFDPGNPVLQVRYSGAVASNVHLEIGLGAAIPTAARSQVGSESPTLAERAASEVSHRAAMSMRGYWSPWRWAPERFALFVPTRVGVRLDDLSLDFDLGVGVMVPVLGGRGVDADVIVQLGAGLGGRLADPLFVGVRVRGVGAPLGRTLTGIDEAGGAASDAVVFSAEPWVRLSLDPVQLTFRAVVSFNGRDGIGGDRAPAVGAFAGVGGEVD